MRWGTGLRVAVAAAVVAVVGGGGAWLMTAGGGETEPIRVGTTDSVTSLDPAGAYDAGSWALFGNVYQSLLTFTRESRQPVPDAARRCGFVGDKLLTYHCELRKGLRFADGREVTARDVQYSFDRIRRIASPQGPAPLLDTLKAVRAQGRRVTFELAAPDATFPFKIATGAGAIVDRTRYRADRLRTDGRVYGSGPYVLTTYEAGRRAVLVPNSRYQGAVKDTGQPVTVRYFADPESLGAAWRVREVDVAGRQLPPADVAGKPSSGPDVRVAVSPAANTRSMVFNLRPGSPLADPLIRRAVAATVDRATLSRDVYGRTVEPLYALIPQGITGHSTAFFDRHPQPDPGAARALLRQAGVRLPVRFGLAYSQGAASGPEAAELERQLEATGLFEVSTRKVEWTQFQKGYARGAYDAYCIGWVADFPDPDNFTAPLVGTGATLHTGYRSPYVDRLLRATARETDRGETRADFRALQVRIARDVPLLPLWQRKDYVLSTTAVSGAEYLSDGTGIWRLWKLGRI